MSNEDTVLKEAYSSFKQRLSFDDFQSKINSLTIDKWNFVRATLLYQQSLKCKECNLNVAMVLLCSCAEAMQLEETAEKRFKEFYERYCPSRLRNPPIEYMPNGKPPMVTAPFDIALHCIYKLFRCFFVHEGIKHLRPEDNIDVLYDKIKIEDKIYTVKLYLPEITNWFEKTTFESLFAMLQLTRIYPPPKFFDF